jgi:sulfatase modifying factor 1
MAAELPELDDGSVVHWEVGHKPANGFGLHEVLGNVWEWCLDGYGDYPNTLQRNPVTRSLGSASRVLRGGSFVDTASYARSAYRHSASPENRDGYLGLRPSQGITP